MRRAPQRGEWLIVARPGYYPSVIRCQVRGSSRTNALLWTVIHHSGEIGPELRRADEGVPWVRGWDLHSPAANALRVAVALR